MGIQFPFEMKNNIRTIFKVLWLTLIFSGVHLSGQQLCDGNLGINIFLDGDFGSGSANIIASDPMIAPGYNYRTTIGAPIDGSYIITNGTQTWSDYFGSWLKLSDNSDDPEGYYMLVNADYNPGLFYEQIVDGLCENTLYEFSADIINVIKIEVSNHILPNVSFLIDDVQQFSSGDIPQDQKWNKYGFTFTTDPGQTSVKLSLRNNAPGGIGNDLALDNISFQACGPSAFVTAEQTIFLCEDDNSAIEIQAEIAANNQSLQWQISYDSIAWQDLSGQMTDIILHNTFDIGRYYYRYITAGTDVELLNEKCRILSDVLVVEVLPLNYLESDTICAGASYPFGNQNLTTSGMYNNIFTSSRGCDSIVDLDLIVLEQETYQIDTTIISPSCYGFADASFEINIVNGLLGPYSYGINEVLTTQNVFEGLSAGAYAVTIVNAQSCVQEINFLIEEPEEFLITLPGDTIIELGESINIILGHNQPLSNLVWNPSETSPCGLCTEFNFLPLSSQVYAATAYNSNDCKAEASMKITIDIEDLEIYIPNVFDPSIVSNIDNNFTIGAKEGLVQSIKEFSIYDRWGNLIHHISDSTNLYLWDGRINNTKANPGVYVYLLELELIDGNVYSFVGDLCLLK